MQYNKVMTTRTRLSTDQKLRALAYIARGDTLSQVAGHMLEEFDVTITESALSQLKKNHADTTDKMQTSLSESAAEDADALLKKTRRMLSVRLDRAERDANELAEVDRQYREGNIKSVEEYRRKKAGLLKISIAELTNVSKTMHAQTVKVPELPPGATPGALPAGGGAQNPAQLEALLNAIKDGNHVEIQRIVFNGGVPNDKPVAVQS